MPTRLDKNKRMCDEDVCEQLLGPAGEKERMSVDSDDHKRVKGEFLSSEQSDAKHLRQKQREERTSSFRKLPNTNLLVTNLIGLNNVDTTYLKQR